MLWRPECFNCKHYLPNPNEEHYSCKAFDIIPEKILFNKIAHTKPIKGQKGKFVFEPIIKYVNT